MEEKLQKILQVNYEASGLVAHQGSDILAKTSPDQGQAVWALWQMGGAWLCTHIWEHYTYTMDKAFLANKAYPLLEGCTSFLLDWLIEGRRGYLETNPSTSPEHTFTAPDGKPASVSYSSTMDMSIIREVFNDIVAAAEVLGKSEDDLIKRVRKAQPRLCPTRIARDGTIMEWVCEVFHYFKTKFLNSLGENFIPARCLIQDNVIISNSIYMGEWQAQDYEDPEPHHRHVSHLFGLFPGHTITVAETPALCKAADNTLYKRGLFGK